MTRRVPRAGAGRAQRLPSHDKWVSLGHLPMQLAELPRYDTMVLTTDELWLLILSRNRVLVPDNFSWCSCVRTCVVNLPIPAQERRVNPSFAG